MQINLTRRLHFLKASGFFLSLFGSSFSNSFCGIGLGVYGGALMLQAFLDKEYRWEPDPARALLALLLVSLAISAGLSHYGWISLRGFGKYLQGFLLLYAGLDVVRSENDKKALLWVLTATFLLAVSSGIYQEIFGADFLRGFRTVIYRGDIMRLTGSFKNCNDYGTFLVPGFTFSLALLVQAVRKKRWAASAAWFLLFAALGYVLARTLSRSSILAAIASLLFFCLFFRARWAALAGTLGAFVALVWLVPSTMGTRLRELSNLHPGDTSERMLLAQTTMRMVEHSPFFGLGLNTYSVYFPQFKPPHYPTQMYSHNSYLQMAAESGLIGISLFLVFVGTVMVLCARDLIKRESSDPSKLPGLALLSGVFGMLVNCLFDSVLQSTRLRFFFWALAGSALALSRLRPSTA